MHAGAGTLYSYWMSRRIRVLAIVIPLLAAGCAPRLPPDVSPALDRRTGIPQRPADVEGTAIPPGVTLEDGLTQDEAVAVALWNNAEFQLQLANLGFARADLLEAGLLRNPVLSLLFPVGPKQLEATLRWPIEVLWERPRRVEAARLAAQSVAAGLEQNGLTLAADVKLAYVEYALARDRARLADQSVTELRDIGRLMQSRFAAGDISALEARAAEIDAARAEQDAARGRLEVALRANDLRARLGLALDARPVMPVVTMPTVHTCGPLAALMEEALASRPDVRAAELAIESAGARLGWERARILTVSAALDANGAGAQGFEAGPGVDVSAPVFDRNQGGRARALAEIQRASANYLVVRQRIATELRDATTQFEQAVNAVTTWRDTVLAPLETQVGVADRAFIEGEVSYLFVLEMNRRLTDARLRTREAEADLARARTRIERATGRACGTDGKEIARAF